MAKKKSELRIQNTEGTPQAAMPVVPEVQTGQAEACPTYTLRADELFGLRAMILISIISTARVLGATDEKLRELEAVMREFELYDEAHRG